MDFASMAAFHIVLGYWIQARGGRIHAAGMGPFYDEHPEFEEEFKGKWKPSRHCMHDGCLIWVGDENAPGKGWIQVATPRPAQTAATSSSPPQMPNELVALISSILHRNGPEIEITSLIPMVYSADPNARALIKAAGGAKRWLEQHPRAFQLFRPRPDEQPLVWSVRLMAPPPPPGLKLEGGSLTGEPAKYIGTYLLDRSKLVNGRPAYQHTSDATLWITFAGAGWIGQPVSLLGKGEGHLYLQDPAAASPNVSTKTWQASAGGAGAAWVETPKLKCTAWTPPLSAAEKAAAAFSAAEKAAAEKAAAEKAAAEKAAAERAAAEKAAAEKAAAEKAAAEKAEKVGAEKARAAKKAADEKAAAAKAPPPPPGLKLEGGSLTGRAAEYPGTYRLVVGKLVNGRPAYQHTSDATRWIAFSGDCWIGQSESALGEKKGFLVLQDPAAASPDVSAKTWQASVGGVSTAWVEAPQLKCTAWTPPPPGLKLEGGSLTGEAAKCPGTYRLVVGKLVNGRPAFQHTSDATLWIAFDGDSWMGQSESELGEGSGFLDLTDSAAASPDVSTNTWKAWNGSDWVEAPQLKCTAWTPPPPGLKLEGGSLPGEAAKYIGTYHLDHRKLVNGRPAFQHTSDATRWIAFAGAGWVGQPVSLLGLNKGCLYLQDPAAASPDVSAKTWQASGGAGIGWVAELQLKCTAWMPPLSAAEKAAAEKAAAEKAAAERAAAERAAAEKAAEEKAAAEKAAAEKAAAERAAAERAAAEKAAAERAAAERAAAERAAAERAAAEKAAAERAAAEKAAAAAAASTLAAAGSPRTPTAASTSRAPGQSQPAPAHVWMWEDGAVGSGAWQLFDTASEETLRNHEAAGVHHFQIEIRGQVYNVDLSRCTQQNVRTGFVRCLKRHALTDVDKDLPSLGQFPGSYGLAPPYWAALLPAGQLPGAASTQGIGHAPYVLGEILSTERIRSLFFGLGVNIRPIERHVALCDFVRSMMPPQLRSRLLTISHIRSEARFNLYQAARDALISRIGGAQLNETWLWHGTSRNTLESIMANGFDRNMNERGQYGVGSTFQINWNTLFVRSTRSLTTKDRNGYCSCVSSWVSHALASWA
jgi:hypothetical protein